MVVARFIKLAATMPRHVACSSPQLEKEGKFKRKGGKNFRGEFFGEDLLRITRLETGYPPFIVISILKFEDELNFFFASLR